MRRQRVMVSWERSAAEITIPNCTSVTSTHYIIHLFYHYISTVFISQLMTFYIISIYFTHLINYTGGYPHIPQAPLGSMLKRHVRKDEAGSGVVCLRAVMMLSTSRHNTGSGANSRNLGNHLGGIYRYSIVTYDYYNSLSLSYSTLDELYCMKNGGNDVQILFIIVIIICCTVIHFEI